VPRAPGPGGPDRREDPSLIPPLPCPAGRRLTLSLAACLLAGCFAVTGARAFPLHAADTPNDEGHSISLSWRAPSPPPAEWSVERRVRGAGPFGVIATVPGDADSFADTSAVDGTPYEYRITAVGDTSLASGISPPAVASLDWFDSGKLNILVLVALSGLAILWYIAQAQRGRIAGFRRIAGLAAIEEAVGRATEMGKGVLYVPGVQDIDDIQTIASMILLGNVSRMTAKYETPLYVPTNSPAVFTVAEEVVRSGYSDAGRIDAYRGDQVRYLTSEQFAYVAAVNGLMLRERPAANLFLGAFFAESLLLAETGHSTGAIQIAGTANVHQLPFFVVACDYTLIGEEYYAASAYLSNDPRLLGSLRASDVIKAVTIAAILLGVVLESVGAHAFRAFFETQ
jgi:hypothetical protein